MKDSTTYIGFLLDKELRNLIDLYCDRTKTGISEYIRNLIRNDLISKGLIIIKNLGAEINDTE